MKDSVNYKKLSRRSASLVAHHRLWKGPDHLLVVKQVGCSEEYKRFYFRDIQAIIVKRTLSYRIWGLVLPCMALAILGAGWSSLDQEWGLWVLIGIIVVLWVVHLVLGRTCACWIQTAINKEKLVMFKRIAQVKRFWTKIEPDLTAAQGAFSIEEMEAEATRQAENPKFAPPPLPSSTPSKVV